MTEDTNKMHPPDVETRGLAEVAHVGADLAAIYLALRPQKPPTSPENK